MLALSRALTLGTRTFQTNSQEAKYSLGTLVTMVTTKMPPKQSEKASLRSAVELASNQFIESLNKGDAAKCYKYYEATAIIRSRPLGMFVGIEAIRDFWQQFLADNKGNMRYLHPMIEVMDDETAVLSCYWKSDNLRGEVFQEIWGLQPDGNVKILQSEISVFPS